MCLSITWFRFSEFLFLFSFIISLISFTKISKCSKNSEFYYFLGERFLFIYTNKHKLMRCFIFVYNTKTVPAYKDIANKYSALPPYYYIFFFIFQKNSFIKRKNVWDRNWLNNWLNNSLTNIFYIYFFWFYYAKPVPPLSYNAPTKIWYKSYFRYTGSLFITYSCLGMLP